jgi:hypothetical protein
MHRTTSSIAAAAAMAWAAASIAAHSRSGVVVVGVCKLRVWR